jgi:hypothetical protein
MTQSWDEHPNEDPRIKAKTLANDLVQVVPMPPPSNMLFYIDMQYNETKS